MQMGLVVSRKSMFIPPVHFLLLTAIKQGSLCTCFKSHGVVSWFFGSSAPFAQRSYGWRIQWQPLHPLNRTEDMSRQRPEGGEILPATQGKEPLETSQTRGLGFPACS